MRTFSRNHIGRAAASHLKSSDFKERLTRPIALIASALLTGAVLSATAQTVYMQDTPADTGTEPNPDTGPMWISQDIWVRNSPDPNWQPEPFPEGSPPWSFPADQNPIYRDPLKSTPNYVYVEVRNHGNTASTGKERLRLYWAKASTGLSWPTQWVDYQPGGARTLLYGAEITEPRKNAAAASAAERTAYVNAVLAVGTNPSFVFPMGTSYWQTQQETHMNMANGGGNIHDTLAFLPWHREFMNRYEQLLQQYDPAVKLLYWDWTTDPSTSLSFMGSFSGNIGAPFNPTTGPTLLPSTVTRGLGPTPPAEADAAVLARSPYDPFVGTSVPPAASAPFMAALENDSHNYSHGYIGGNSMCCPALSAQDPFFFMLHGNVDRLWAQWQRDSANLARLDPAQTYGAALATDQNLNLTMAPWDGSPGVSGGSANSFKIQPWETTTTAPSGGNYVVVKHPSDPSVVSPPIYDAAPLTVPVLQPGEAVIIQIPWYPPNPADFAAAFGPDQGHVCLLARIETSTAPPFGMDTPESSDVFANTKNNNKIVWKNVTVVDDFPGRMWRRSILLRNIFDKPVQASLRITEPKARGGSFFKEGRIFVTLAPRLLERWKQAGAGGQAVKPGEKDNAGRIEILSPDAMIRNIRLNPNEAVAVNAEFVLSKNYAADQKSPAQIDLIQLGAPGNPDKMVGGQRFTLDLRKISLVKSGDLWRYWDRRESPGENWSLVDYNDARWSQGSAPLGSGGNQATTLAAGLSATTYFRHTFEVDNSSFYRNLLLRIGRADGVIVFLNGREVYRVNLPAGRLKSEVLATRAITGLEGEVLISVKIDSAQLKSGKNVLAAEIHANSRQGHIQFDLELLANTGGAAFPPNVAFAGLADGSMFETDETVPVRVDALSGDAKIDSVTLYVDGKNVGTKKVPPYEFALPSGSPGQHRLRAVTVDSRGLTSSSTRTVVILEHVLPLVKLVDAVASKTVSAGQAIPVNAEASVRKGKIARVEFWVKDMATFTSPTILAGTATAAPYSVSIKDLKPGHYMYWAIAVNDHGGTTQSYPGHIMVEPRK